MSEFFAMGGYGQYVWTAYATFAIVMIGIGVGPLLKHRQIKAKVRRLARRRESQS